MGGYHHPPADRLLAQAGPARSQRALAAGDSTIPRLLPASTYASLLRLATSPTVLVMATIGLLLAGIFAWDLMTPLGQVPWLLYAPVLLLTLLLPYRWDALALAGLCTVLIIVDLFYSSPVSDPRMAVFFNRSVGTVLIWTTAIGCLLYKRSQRALQTVQERFTYLLQNNPAVLYACDASQDWAFSFISENVRDVLGYDARAFLQDARLWIDCMHPDDRPKALGEGVAALFDRGHHTFEYRFRHRNGVYRWLRDEVRLVSQSEPGGDRLLCIGFCSDITERKLSEEALGKLRRENKLILAAAGEGIYGLDLGGNTTFVNPAAACMIGWNPEEVIGKPQHAVLHHTNPDGTPYSDKDCPIYAVLRDGIARRVDTEVFWRKDGTSFPVEYISTPIRDEDGGLIGAVVTFRDITERRRVEEALRASESRFRTILDNSPNPIFLKDLQGRYLLVNREFERALSVSRQDILGKADAEVFPAAQAAAFQANDRKVLEAGCALEFEEEAVQKDGPHTSLVHKFPLCDEQGIPYAIGGIVTDITAHKKAEEALKESEGRLRAIVDSEPECVTLIGLDGTLLEMNPAGLAMIEVESAADVLGKHVLQLIHPEDRQAFWGLHVSAGNGMAGTLRFRLFGLRGTMRWVETHAGPLRDAGGKVASVLSVTRDITERKRAEELLQSSRDQLRALSSHLQSVREQERARIARELHDEFGQVLTGLKMDLAWLGGRLNGRGRCKTAKPLLDRMHTMTNLVDESIAMIRKLVAELRPAVLDHLDLAAALEWQTRDFRQRTGIECEFHCTLTGIELDRDRTTAVFRLVQEALTNVARHAKAARVVVWLEEAQGWLQLVVEDDGKGITDQEISGPTSFGILGMRERVALLGGQIAFHGRPAAGTTVIVRFPAEGRA